MSYNTKNYTEQGGEKTVIGGILEFTEEAVIENFPGGKDSTYVLPTATATRLGGVKIGDGLTIKSGVLSVNPVTPAAKQAPLSENAAASDVVTAFNALLAALQAAGFLAAE